MTFLPMYSTEPLTILPGGSMTFMMDMPSVVLPLPDSPTTPKVYPTFGISSDTFSRAVTWPCLEKYFTVTLRTWRIDDVSVVGEAVDVVSMFLLWLPLSLSFQMVNLGFITSSSEKPISAKPVANSEMSSPGAMIHHQAPAVNPNCCPQYNMLPRLTTAGFPMPRNSKAVAIETEKITFRIKYATAIAPTSGTMTLMTIERSLRPLVFSAST